MNRSKPFEGGGRLIGIRTKLRFNLIEFKN